MVRNQRTGFACILALILVAIMAAMAVAFASGGNTNLQQSGNQVRAQQGLLQSESGLAYMAYQLRGVTLPAGCRGTAMLSALAGTLGARMNGTPNLNGVPITTGGSTIYVPTISTEDGQFSATVTLESDTSVHMTVAGSENGVGRAVGLDFSLTGSQSSVFDYGIATKSAVRLIGNARIRGVNDPSEANILSATYSNPESFNLSGNTSVAGDIFSSNPASYVTTTGNASVGGTTGAAMQDHIHIGVGDVEFPEVDQSVFEPSATNIVTAATPKTGNLTFTNIRIRANVNPTFSGNITMKGVVFVEAPNRVTFTGNLNLTGVIVTQDAGEGVYTTNTIRFTGNSTFHGVESLPDTSEFHDLRQLPGTFLLAPGFGVSFTGNFGAVNGCMAADAFTWTGNASGTVNGPIINYSDSVFSMTGNSNIAINRSTYPGTPPGFSSSSTLSPVPSSYREY